MSKLLLIISLVFFGSFTISNEESPIDMLTTVNKLRQKGCNCSGEYMKPVQPLSWNDVLYQSAMDHALEMEKFDYFSHYSKEGLSIGKRMDNYDYPWHFVGENIGEGQQSFIEVFRDWKNSKSHCKMMMNPKMEEMAIAKHGKFWVQHFGKQIPKGATKK
jgi:uncharacterized protein YkwD